MTKKFGWVIFMISIFSDTSTDMSISYADKEAVKKIVKGVKKEITRQVKEALKGLDVTDFCKPTPEDIQKVVDDHFWEII